jgi:dTDP-4-amino-4,6-dideoxygalactose transaminase
MNENFLPFAKPSINRQAIDEVVACLESGWITTGPRVKQFEEDLANYFQAPHVLALSSATAGLHLALLTLNLKPGDEIITTPLTFVCTLNTIEHSGGIPVLVDIDPTTFNMDIQKLENAITPRTKAILPVHFTGVPVDLDPIYRLAEQYKLRVIEDCAQAMGTHYKNRRLGSFGDTQIFSFHPNKNMTTGEGGCLVTRNPELANQIAALRFHGIDRQAWDRFSKKGNQHYDVLTPGYKYNMMDIQAALGLHQLPELEHFIERRTYLANRYHQHLHDWPQISLQAVPNYPHRHSWHLYTILINPDSAGMDRDTFMQQMKEYDVGTGLHYNPAHLFDFYRQKYGYKLGDFPEAENVGSRIVSLPLFPSMTDAEQDRVLNAMDEIVRGK